MPVTVAFRDELPEPVQRELDHDFTKLRNWLLREHNEDGTHRFPDFTEGDRNIQNSILEILDRYQAKGQFWKYGPWLFNDASDPRAGRAWLRPPNPAAGTYHNYQPIGIDTAIVLELEPAGDITITGIKAREGLTENRLLIIRNRDSSATITMPHEDTGSLAPYRFDITNDQDIVLGPRESAWFLYDTGRERWSVIVTGMTQGPVSSGSPTLKAQVEITIDGGGSVIATGQKYVYSRVPWNFTPTGCEVVSDVSGSIVVDLWKDTYANFPPTNADSIVASAKPTLSSAQKSQDLTLTGWTTPWAEGDRLEVEVESCTTITKAIVSVYGTRSS